jgi:hypothetical protein
MRKRWRIYPYPGQSDRNELPFRYHPVWRDIAAQRIVDLDATFKVRLTEIPWDPGQGKRTRPSGPFKLQVSHNQSHFRRSPEVQSHSRTQHSKCPTLMARRIISLALPSLEVQLYPRQRPFPHDWTMVPPRLKPPSLRGQARATTRYVYYFHFSTNSTDLEISGEPAVTAD